MKSASNLSTIVRSSRSAEFCIAVMMMLIAVLVCFICFTFSPSNSTSTERPGGGQEVHSTKARDAAAFGPAKENIDISSDKLHTLVLGHRIHNITSQNT